MQHEVFIFFSLLKCRKHSKWAILVQLTEQIDNSHFFLYNQSIPILIWVYPRKQGWPDLAHPNSNLSNAHSSSCSIQGILLFPNQHSCSPSTLASSMSSLVILASSCPSLQTPKLFSKHAHHPSSTHARTISLHSPLPSEPLFLSIRFLYLKNKKINAAAILKCWWETRNFFYLALSSST